MQVTFYNMTSPTIKVNKTLGNPLGTCDASPNPTGPVDVVNPVIVVDADKVPYNANYMVIGAPLNRKYFISAISYDIAKTATIAGHSDVISNFAPTGNLNFISGDKDLNMVEDESYPLTDLFVAPIIHYPFNNWDGNFTNNGVGKRYIVRTVTSKARQAYER